MKQSLHAAEIITIETGIDRAAARINAESQPTLARLQSEWGGLQLALRSMSSAVGMPIRTQRWEYQWPTIEREIGVIDDAGHTITTPALVSVHGLLRHTPRSLAIGALDQLHRCQTDGIPILPAAQSKLWDIIESRTIGYSAVVTPTRPGTAVFRDHVEPFIAPLNRGTVESTGVKMAEQHYDRVLRDQASALADFRSYIGETQFGPTGGGQFVPVQQRAV